MVIPNVTEMRRGSAHGGRLDPGGRAAPENATDVRLGTVHAAARQHTQEGNQRWNSVI
jgi:hypothetical protein